MAAVMSDNIDDLENLCKEFLVKTMKSLMLLTTIVQSNILFQVIQNQLILLVKLNLKIENFE